jgi:CHAT domain-containing protein
VTEQGLPPELVERVAAVRALPDRRAVEAWRSANCLHDVRAVADALLRAAASRLRSEPAVVRDHARRALWLLEGREQVEELLHRCEQTLAEVALLLGSFDEALAHCDAAERHLPRGARRLEHLVIDNLRMQAWVHLERFDDAARCGERALASAGEASTSGVANWMRMNLADLAFRQDRPRAALDLYAEIERLLPTHAPSTWQAAIASNRANALEAVQRFHAAERHFAKARQLFTDAGCDHTVAQVGYNAAYAASLRGRYGDALQQYEELEPVFRKHEDVRHLAHIALDRAEIHLHLHMPVEAEAHALEAGQGFGQLGLRKEQAQAVFLAARAAEQAGRGHPARERYAEAQQQFAALGLADRALGCRVQLAREALDRGSLTEAEAHLAAGRSSIRPEAALLIAVGLDLVAGRVALARGQAARALGIAQRIGAATRRVEAPWLHLETAWIAARAHVALGAMPEAVDAYRIAINLLERHRVGVPPDEYMTAFLAGHAEVYAEVVSVLVQQGEVDDAFHMAERAKSRALVDLLAGRHAGATVDGDPDVAQRLRHLRERLAALYRRLVREDGGADVRSARTLRNARAEAERMEDEVARIQRRGRLRQREALSLASVGAPDLASVRRDLDADTTLVEYVLTGSTLYTFVVSREALQIVRRAIERDAIRTCLQRFRFHLSKCERTAETEAPELLRRATEANLKVLSDLLLAPLREHLVTPRVVIVPDGLLHHVPFHALPWTADEVLAERFDVVYAPSAAVYRFCRRARSRSAGPHVAILGLPDELAPAIEREARAVASTSTTDRVYLGAEATYDRLRHEALDARVLHVATHGMFRPERPMLSAIRLADGWITLYDLYDLKVRSDLVVLSACESGTAGVTEGNEILGLTRGLLYAGASCLVASQWRVHDEVTSEFMEHFYGALRAGAEVASALRTAMTTLRRTRPHPYFWAPFFLVGRPPIGGLWGLPTSATPCVAPQERALQETIA